MKKVNFKPIIKALFITYCIGQLAACSKDYNFTPPPPPPPCDTCPVADLSFKNDILPIFTAKCISCHNTTKPVLTAAAAYAALATYINTGAPANSLLLTTFDSGKMSSIPTGITAAEKKKILDWIKQGAKNN